MLLNIQTQLQAILESSPSNQRQLNNMTGSITASTVVESASALLNLFSVLSGDQEYLSFNNGAVDEYTIQRNGLELRVGGSPEDQSILTLSIKI